MEKCLAEAAMRNNLVTFLAKEGGTSYKEVIRRIMSKTLTNELAVSFSWKGWKAKEEFSKYILAGVIIEAVEKK
ncbi:hypothetical protein NQ317_015362 [Molorchus minor]|uniref:DUF4806 domain-containing protein n=1 Tax=Molorchus minor TaxID=1323400 RepID=A0ABQ9J6D9_9CUCU|nr:hypothetical protein NQ317_015362 [Molorchus minor]